MQSLGEVRRAAEEVAAAVGQRDGDAGIRLFDRVHGGAKPDDDAPVTHLVDEVVHDLGIDEVQDRLPLQLFLRVQYRK